MNLMLRRNLSKRSAFYNFVNLSIFPVFAPFRPLRTLKIEKNNSVINVIITIMKSNLFQVFFQYL